MVTTGAITFYLTTFHQIQLGHMFSDTPSGSKVMIHGVGTPQYQGYGEKILVGSLGLFSI
jgi:hypothetical protein